MRQFFLLGLLTLLFPFALSAQNITVSGKVFDSSTNEPLVGVTVVQTGTQNGTITDIDGNYSISVPGDASLTFSYIGYVSNTVFVNGKSTLPVYLDTDDKTLEQVVVVGYGTMKKSDVSGSVVSVDTKDMMKRSPANVNQGLQGAAAGVMVTAQDGSPDGNSQVRIRGVATINGNAQPLYVIDGVQVGTDANFLNPADIKSIEVLKDASATAIYGAAGANGVIMITTNQGSKGTMVVNVSADWSIQTLPYKLETFKDVDAYAQTIRQAIAVDSKDGRTLVNPVWGAEYDGKRNYIDWQDQMTRPALRQQYNISANGGTDKATYNFSLGWLNNDGLVVNSNYKRLTGRASAKVNVNKYFSFGGDINFIHSENYGSNGVFSNNGNLSSLRDFAFLAPTLDYIDNATGQLVNVNVENPDGSYGAGEQVTPQNWEGNTSIASNYYAQQMEVGGKNYNNRVLSSAYAEITFFKGLTLKSVASYNYSTSGWNDFSGGHSRFNYINGVKTEIPMSADQTYSLTLNQSQGNTIQAETYLTYAWKNDIHNFTIMAGHSFSKYWGFHNEASVYDFMDSNIRNTNMSLNEDRKLGTAAFNADVRGISYFGRLTYSLFDRYILTGTVRRDGSSNFGKGNKWGVFPSAALAWRISEESFLKDNDVVSNLKLRLGWGRTGNAGGLSGKGIAALSSSGVAYNYYNSDNNTIGPNSTMDMNNRVGLKVPLVDPGLKWETNEQTNIGLDFGFYRGTISGSIDYFVRTTTDLLIDRPTRPSTGYASVYTNFGKIINKGVEISLTYNKKINDDLDFSVTFNGSTLKNEIDEIGGQPFFATNNGTTNDGSNVGAVGDPAGFHWNNHSVSQAGSAVGSFWGYRVAGIFQSQEEIDALNKQANDMSIARGDREVINYYQEEKTMPGDYKFEDINGDGYINEKDMDVLGNGLPKFNYGINVNVNYKQFDFSLYCYGVAGQKIYSYSAMRLSNIYSGDDQTTPNLLKDSYNDIWSPSNPGGTISQLTLLDYNYNRRGSDAWVKKGDFFRISNIQIGYTFKKEWLAPLLINNARAYVSVQNLALISKYKKYGDPECGQGSVLFSGLDTGRYPMPRTFVFGINLQF